MSEEKLIEMAREASQEAWAPYSGYRLGAALETADGTVITGCNVENGSYSLTICAERNAIFRAIAEGYREFRRLVVYVDADRLFPPCGACRQVLAEFATDLEILVVSRTETVRTTLRQLLPMTFRLEPTEEK
jgi:cytidine deaminase